MDPITAFLRVVEALTRLVTVMAESQTPAQREQLWNWYIADIARWRKLLKIDDQ